MGSTNISEKRDGSAEEMADRSGKLFRFVVIPCSAGSVLLSDFLAMNDDALEEA